MRQSHPIKHAWFCLGLLVGLISAPAPIAAAVAEFTEALTSAQQTAIGVAKLSPSERSALSEFVAREVMLARQGDVTSFTGTFVGRRSAEQRQQAGLDRLTADEQQALNEIVARTIATRPVSFAYNPKMAKSDVPPANFIRRLEIHGEFSLTYGWVSGGGSFKGGSFSTTIHDPKTGITVGFSYSQFSGPGWVDDYGYWGDPGWSVRGRETSISTPVRRPAPAMIVKPVTP
jgi:hypothetical protein